MSTPSSRHKPLHRPMDRHFLSHRHRSVSRLVTHLFRGPISACSTVPLDQSAQVACRLVGPPVRLGFLSHSNPVRVNISARIVFNRSSTSDKHHRVSIRTRRAFPRRLSRSHYSLRHPTMPRLPWPVRPVRRNKMHRHIRDTFSSRRRCLITDTKVRVSPRTATCLVSTLSPQRLAMSIPCRRCHGIPTMATPLK